MASSMRSITPLGKFNPVHPVTPYAFYPYREEQSMVSPYDNSDSAAKRWAESAKKAAESIDKWLQEVRAARLSVQQLLQAPTSAWEERVAVSSNDSSVTGQAVRGAPQRTYEITVGRLASSQINQGYVLPKSGRSVISVGGHFFAIASSGGAARLAVRIVQGDTNGMALGKIANAINEAKLGIAAWIMEDKKTGTLQLELKSGRTGKSAGFSLSDLERSSAVTATGIFRVGQTAEDVFYRINNGEWETAQENAITLDNGKVSLSFHETTPASIHLTIGVNASAVAKQVHSILEKINRLFKFLDAAAGLLDTSLKTRLFRAMTTSEPVGIMQSPTGEWIVDNNRLAGAIANDRDLVKRCLNGSAGWAALLARTLEIFELMPAQEIMNPDAVAAGQFTLYKSSLQSYWQLPVSGWIMNSRW